MATPHQSPTQIAAQTLKQQLGGKASTSAPPLPVGYGHQAINAIGGAAKAALTIPNAYQNFTQNLSDHLMQSGVQYGQNIGQGFQNAANDLTSTPTGQTTNQQMGQQGIFSGPSAQQFVGGMSAVNDVLQPTIVKPAAAITKPIGDAWNVITSKLNPVVDFLSGQPRGTTQIANDQAGQQATQAYQQISQQHPTAMKALESLAGIGEAGMTIAGATQAAEGIKAGYGRLQTQAADTLANTPPPTEAPTPTEAPAKPGSLADAQAARGQVAQQSVDSLQNIQQQVGQYERGLGPKFQAAGDQVAQADPSARLNLSNDQIARLNALKEGKNFSLPDYLDNSSQASLPDGKFGQIKLTPEAQAEFEAGQQATNTSLDPSQAQDLIRRLNKSTYKEVGGSLQVDQQRVDLTNEIKQSAQSSFGHVTDANGESVWNKAYQDYSKGINAVQKMNDIVNLDSSATPSDINKSLNNLLKLSKTPEGKIILQNSLDEFQAQSGIDLSQPTQAIQKVLDSQEALDIAQTKAAKPGFIKQVTDPVFLTRSAIRYGLIYVGIKGLINLYQKSVSGK